MTEEEKGRKNVEGLLDKPVMFHVRLSQMHKDRLAAEAARLGMQMSEYIRFVLVNHFKEQDREDRAERLSRVGGS